MNLRGLVRAMTMAVAAACIAWAAAAAAQPSGAALRTTYEKLAPSLANSAFGRPIALTSGETANGLKGDVYGVVDHPLAQLSATLGKLANWCDMLLLHLNNRACRVDERAIVRLDHRHARPCGEGRTDGSACVRQIVAP